MNIAFCDGMLMIDALPDDGDKIGNLGYKYFNDALLSYKMNTD